MANSEIKHIDLSSIGSGASGVSVPGFGSKRKSAKKKITKHSKKVISKGKGGGVQSKERKTKREEKPKAPPKAPPKLPPKKP